MFPVISKAAFSAARVAPRAARNFSMSAVASKDFVQEAYLRELKAYKPAPKAADAHKGQVREFQAPSAPQAPSVPSTSDLSSELDAYSKSEPDVEAAAPASGSSLTETHQDANAYLEEAKKDYVVEAHH